MGQGALPVLLAAVLLVGHAAGGLGSAQAAGASQPHGGTAFQFGEKPGSITPTPRIAIVSEKAFHLEVLAGFIAALEPYASELVVYLHPMNFDHRAYDFGFMELLDGFKGQVRALPAIFMPQYDYMVFISPEYRVNYITDLIRQAQPKGVLLMVHNGDVDGVLDLPFVHNNATLVTLSPHVAKYVGKRLNRVIDWMLPLKELAPKSPCKATDKPDCLSGFAIQGMMDARRRNYSEIWHQMDEVLNNSKSWRDDARLHVNVVGSGNPAKLLVPPHLKTRVTPHVNLKFPEFYELIYHNYALVPTLAQEAYYDRKFSSTLITSLVTTVPVIVSERFLAAYSFLSKDDVYLQMESETTLDVGLRILRMKPQEVQQYRNRLFDLRHKLSNRAAAQLHKLMREAFTGK